MSSRRRILAPIATALLLAATACASTKATLGDRFAKYQDCPRAEVSVHDAGGNIYVVSGCGKRVEYVCTSFVEPSNAPGRGCVEQGTGPTRAPGLPPPPPPAQFDPPK